MIVAVPHEDDATREQAMREVEAIMRIRHGLRLDAAERLRPGHAGCGAEDLASRSASGIFLALVVLSSIALMVGGIGVMAS